MAKSIEQKLVDTLATSLHDSRFNPTEFARLMTKQDPHVNVQFFNLMLTYMDYLTVFKKHGWYPNGTELAASVSDLTAYVMRAAKVSP